MRLSKSKHVATILTNYPRMAVDEVAKRANCTRGVVYTVRWAMKKAAAKSSTSVLPSTKVSIKDACEVLQRAVGGVDNLDVTVLGNLVQFDFDGSLYAATPAEASVVLDAIKTLKTYAV